MKKLNSNEILGISLLSVTEAMAADNNIPLVAAYWWLRTPSYDHMTAVVSNDGSVITNGGNVDNAHFAVRPVLYADMESESVLPIGEKILFGDRIWTHIAKNVFLCDEVIAWMAFRKDRKAADANAYEASDIKKYLDTWLSRTLSECRKTPELSQEEKLRIYYEQAHSLHMQDAKKRAIDYIEAEGCNPAI